MINAKLTKFNDNGDRELIVWLITDQVPLVGHFVSYDKTEYRVEYVVHKYSKDNIGRATLDHVEIVTE